jgi:hypothetical protein
MYAVHKAHTGSDMASRFLPDDSRGGHGEEEAIVTQRRPGTAQRQRPKNPLDHEPEAVTYAREQAGLTKTQLADACGGVRQPHKRNRERNTQCHASHAQQAG